MRAGCALVVAGTLPETETGSGRKPPVGWLDKVIPLGMYPFAIGTIAFGVDHFLYTSYVATLVAVRSSRPPTGRRRQESPMGNECSLRFVRFSGR
jgi:hypothetical protein